MSYDLIVVGAGSAGMTAAEFAAGILPPAAVTLFDAMPVADRRHGLDVARRLAVDGLHDRDLLAAWKIDLHPHGRDLLIPCQDGSHAGH